MNRHLARKGSPGAAKIALFTAMMSPTLCACGGTTSPTGPSYPECSAAAEECLDRLDVGSGLSLPFYRNFSLTAPNAAVTQAIVVVHGGHRDANEYYYTMETASEQAGQDETTIVVAPRFECSEDSPPSGDVYWQCSGDDWSHGYPDANGAANPIYSYAVIDRFVSLLAAKATFPNLARIIVTGLGSGGQLTQRYAATNAIDPVSGVALEYLVVSPSSYVYLDAAGAPDRSRLTGTPPPAPGTTSITMVSRVAAATSPCPACPRSRRSTSLAR
jgi:poly(3-hydroxybutyrate) depolymerase